MNLLHYIPAFREHLSVIRGRRPGTVDNYTRTLEMFNKWIENQGSARGIDIQAITANDVEAWMKDLFFQQGNFKNVSRATKLSALKTFWRFLKARGIVSANILELVPSPKVMRTIPEKFTTTDLRRIFSAPDLSKPSGIRDIAIFKVLYGSGPRVSEIRGLNLSDIRVDGVRSYLHYYTKGGKERSIPLLRNPTEALMRWITIREKFVDPLDPDRDAVFLSLARNHSGRRLSTNAFNDLLKRAASSTGVDCAKVFIHKMRTTYATDLYDSGCGLLEVSHNMGHTDSNTTKAYIAISEKALKKTVITAKRWKELDGDRED